ncbi:DUF4178 domain-containing protein [Paraflavisolibacter sp. H34]|uniref:DUF4178 domain-containing protein n=1 Tax=Huijunlia imazamoxiresistens TaxID=3127457 RepID=UPI00301617F3
MIPDTCSLQQCPGCSRPVSFAHPGTTLLPCTCGTVIHRKPGGELESKAVYILPEPFDTLQPGSSGSWKGRHFRVLGRIRAWSETDVLNYWTLVFDGGELALLQEGYGLYALLQLTHLQHTPSNANLLYAQPGQETEFFTGKTHFLERISSVYKWELEGEAYLPGAAAGFRLLTFAERSGGRLALGEFPQTGIMAFNLTPTRFTDLRLTDIRTYANPGKTFACTHCRSPVHAKTYPYCLCCTCFHCGTAYYFAKGEPKAQYFKNASRPNSDITLGSFGSIGGITYEVVGFSLKEELNQYAGRWKEYTLFHPQEGYAFLNEYQGHWIYARERNEAPARPFHRAMTMTYQNEPFRLYNAYHYKAVEVLGEFPYNVLEPGKTQVLEFISPPEMWVQEKDQKGNISWYLGEYVFAAEMEQHFSFPFRLPPQWGVGALQPTGYINPAKLVSATLLAIACLVAVHVLAATTREERLLTQNTYTFPNDWQTSHSLVAGRYRLDKYRSNVQIDLSAPVYNSWLELEATLTNVQTGAEYSLEQGVEYYEGFDEGEHWSEGRQRERAYITLLPAGTYILQLQATREPGKVSEFTVSATYDVPNHRNLLFGLLALLIWPVIRYFWILKKERDRWYDSPFTPYTYED